MDFATPSFRKKFEAVTEPQPKRTRNMTPMSSPNTPRHELLGVSLPFFSTKSAKGISFVCSFNEIKIRKRNTREQKQF